MVQFGIFDHIEGMPGTDMGQLLRDRLDLIKMADQAGFYAYHLAEHHGTDLCMAPNQEIFLAAAAQVTSTIRLGPLVKILPLHHPLRVIEDICLLDQLTGGRVEYGVGRGIAAIEHFWFQGDWFESRERFDEAIALILRGLQTGVTGGRGREALRLPRDQPQRASGADAEPAHVVRRQPHRRRPVRVRAGLAGRHPAGRLRPLRVDVGRVQGRPGAGRRAPAPGRGWDRPCCSASATTRPRGRRSRPAASGA